jgi:trans-2,3-dihydro-3-hydroxyanthranilate isomerase
MKLPFYIVDVFAEKKYAGNQLAVFENAQNLTTEQMQAIASEINFAESTFITQLDAKNNTAEIRIFTPEFEMKFAGHPIIGTSWVLMNRINTNSSKKINLTVPVGTIPVSQEGDLVWLQAAQPEFFDTFSSEGFLEFSNLKKTDFSTEFLIQEVSTGSAFVIVPLQNKEALANLELNTTKMNEWLHLNCKTNFRALYFFYLEDGNLFSRMLYLENNQLKEDAATGSASTCLQAYLLRYYSSNLQLINQQGDYIGRPSRIYFDGKWSQDHFEIKIGGKTQFIAKGEWEV